MAEGISTRLLREIGQQQKELERIEAKFDCNFSQLRSDLEQLGADMRRMFEQVMGKIDIITHGKKPLEAGEEGSKGNVGLESSQLLSTPSVLTGEVANITSDSNYRYGRFGRLECPKFEGEDFNGWLMKLEQYFEVEKVPVENKIQIVMMQLEGRALHWDQYYAKANGGLASLQWADYLEELRRRFGDSEFADPMSELVSLKQSNSVEEYYEQFLSSLNALQLSQEYALSIFISNLKLELAKTVRLFYPHALGHQCGKCKS